MEIYFEDPTPSTPLVMLDARLGYGEIAGRSIPVDAECFYAPVLSWFDGASAFVHRFHLHIKIDFINIASTKRLLYILYRLNAWQLQGKAISITWHYPEYDSEMLEVGEDFAQIVPGIPFEFKRFERSLSQAPEAVPVVRKE
jgi:hypothetical protein